MKREKIEQLLARYYDGQTDRKDEEHLYQALLKADDMSPELKSERALFLSLHQPARESDISVPDGLEAKLEALIDRKAAMTRRLWWKWGAVAASLLLIVGIGFSVTDIHRPAVPQDTFTNPEDAQRALKAIFTEMSHHWNEGMEQLEASQRDIMATNREIKTEFEP